MGLTPQTPNLGQVAKSFWDRKEGTAGKLVLVVLAAGAGLAGILFWGIISAFLVDAAANTLELCLLLGALAVVTSPIWDRNIRRMVTLAYQQTIRWGYGKFVQLDPIGILRTNILEIQKKAQVFGKGVEQLSGARERLSADLEQQRSGIQKNKQLAEATGRQIDSLTKMIDQQKTPQQKQDLQLKIQSLSLAQHGYAQAAGFQFQTIKTEQPLLDKADSLYSQLTRLQTLAEFKVSSMNQQADMLEKRRAMVQSTASALSAATGILKGDPQQNQLIEQAVAYLDNEANDTIGALNDFSRWSDKYLTDMDIQNDAAADEAMKMFAAMEQKLTLPAPGGVTITDLSAMPDLDSPEIQKLLK